MEQSEVTQSLEEQTSDTWRYVEYIESMEQQCLFNIVIKRKACAFQSILFSRAPVSHEKVYKVTFKEKLLLCKIYKNTLKCFFFKSARVEKTAFPQDWLYASLLPFRVKVKAIENGTIRNDLVICRRLPDC